MPYKIYLHSLGKYSDKGSFLLFFLFFAFTKLVLLLSLSLSLLLLFSTSVKFVWFMFSLLLLFLLFAFVEIVLLLFSLLLLFLFFFASELEVLFMFSLFFLFSALVDLFLIDLFIVLPNLLFGDFLKLLLRSIFKERLSGTIISETIQAFYWCILVKNKKRLKYFSLLSFRRKKPTPDFF